ncbi:4Fe-4S binding protein, partial [bacterium]|nr:4Fe-4S binding protein [bacterium]
MSIRILTDECIGCQICVKACPFAAITMVDKKAVIDLDKCTFCSACIESCKFAAIELKREFTKTENIGHYKGVWVFGEQKKGIVQPVAYELLGKGKELAQKLHTQLSCVLIG